MTSRHSPQGECGLKSRNKRWTPWAHQSLPARGVWIEIFGPFGQAKRDRVALLTESVD